MASCTAASVGSRSARMLHGTSARSKLLGGGVGPARAQQRLVGERPVQANAVERLLAPARSRPTRTAACRARGWTCRGSRASAASSRLDLAGPVELLDRLRLLAVLQQRDAEVVGGEARQALRVLQPLQHLDRVARPAERQVDVRAQELDVVADLVGDFALDPLERLQRIVGLVLLEVDARQPEGRLVAHRLVDVAFEHRLDRAAGAVVHAVVELEVADRELGAVDVVVERVERGSSSPWCWASSASSRSSASK